MVANDWFDISTTAQHKNVNLSSTLAKEEMETTSCLLPNVSELAKMVSKHLFPPKIKLNIF